MTNEPVPVALHLEDFTHTPVGRLEKALDSVSLSVEPGERLLLVGASGSGKSTILKALAGLIPRDGDDPDLLRPASGVSLMVQNPLHAFVASATGLEIAFAPENAEVPRDAIPSAVDRAAREARVTWELERDPFALSGGQQQRLALAGILACEAGALLFDEPLAMLDSVTASRVREAILGALGSRTAVIADHHPGPWLPHVDRVLRVSAGGALKDVTAQLREANAGESGREGRLQPSPEGSRTVELLLSTAPTTAFDGRELLAHPVGVEARAGELTVLTGPSGVGKSTLLRHVLAASREGSRKRPLYGASWLPQNPEQLFVAQTVSEEMAHADAASHEVGEGTREATSEEALRAVGLAHLEHANPFSLSGGEQRRLAFAVALASGRRVLLLDEPTVGLDDTSFEAVAGLIREALARGCAVVAATHDDRLSAMAHERRELVPAASVGPPTGHTEHPGADSATTPRAIPRVPRPLHVIATDRWNPLALLGVAAAAFVGGMFVRSLEVGLVGLVVVTLFVPLTWRSATRTALRLGPVVLGAVMVAWSTFLLSGHGWTSPDTWRLAVSEGLRIFTMVAPGALVMESLEPTRLGQALAQQAKLPTRFCAAMIAGLSRLGHTFGQWNDIMLTRQVRGIHRRSPVKLYASATFALLVGVLRSAEIQAFAMDARGFAEAYRRTWTHESRFTRADLGALACALMAVGAPTLATLVL